MDLEVNENWEEWDPKTVPFYVHMIAGISGGVTEHAVMFPVDTLKVIIIYLFYLDSLSSCKFYGH